MNDNLFIAYHNHNWMSILDFIPASVGMTTFRLVNKSWKTLVDEYYAFPNHFIMAIAPVRHFNCTESGCICNDPYFEELDVLNEDDFQHNLRLNIGVLTKSQFVLAESVFVRGSCHRSYDFLHTTFPRNMLADVPRAMLSTYIDAMFWLIGGEADPQRLTRLYKRMFQIDPSVNLAMLLALYLVHFGHELVTKDIPPVSRNDADWDVLVDVEILYTLLQNPVMNEHQAVLPLSCVDRLKSTASFRISNPLLTLASRYVTLLRRSQHIRSRIYDTPYPPRFSELVKTVTQSRLGSRGELFPVFVTDVHFRGDTIVIDLGPMSPSSTSSDMSDAAQHFYFIEF